MENIRYFKLKNKGGFVARIHVNYRKSDGDSWSTWKASSDICAAAERTVDLSDCDIPNGAHVRLIAYIALGSDKTADEEYIYTSDAGKMATYTVSGTTLLGKLKLDECN